MLAVNARVAARCRAGAALARARPVATLLGALVAAIAPGLALAGDAVENVFELHISNGAVPAAQRMMRVAKGDKVRWRVTSDVAGQIHLHAYRLQADVNPDKGSEIAFDAFATGRFRVEWHAATARTDPGGAHRAAPLATFEVRPK